MRLRDARALKAEILANYYNEVIGRSSDLRTETEPPIAPSERRIAVGLAKVRNAYRVEIRIQREGGAAQRLTQDLQRKYGSGINVEILQKVEIPPLLSIKRLSPQTARPRKGPRARLRPLEIGCSVGHAEGRPGTLGALVELNSKGGDAILSNAHVLAPVQEARRKDAIYQPGREGRPLTDDDRIGQLRNHIHLTKSGANTADAAIALLDDEIKHDRNFVPAHYGVSCAGKSISGVQSALELPRGTILAKIGRTTDYTEGILTAVATDDVTVLYHSIGNLRFDNLIEITWKDLRRPFTRPGDSGALVFNPETMRAVGLHFAGGEIKRDGKKVGVSYACDLGTVLDSIECTLIR